MTMAYERTRALVQTGEGLQELSRDSSVSEEVRNSARFLARHYPRKWEILAHGKFCEHHGPENEEPFLTSKTEWEPSR
jgi:hypothetical protein